MIAIYLAIALFLLLLNGFFVLAEFAAVKMRPSRIEELVDANVAASRSVKRVQDQLDEYLSVCQLGITFSSIGLGFVAEPAVVRLVEPLVDWFGWFPTGSTEAAISSHSIAFLLSYLLVSYLHILIGELVPKSIAIRSTEKASLWTAPPLILFRYLLFLPLQVLNRSANLVLRWIGLGNSTGPDVHSEDELRILLNQSQAGGIMSFRRLLFAENVFDLGDLRVRDAMRSRSQVRVLSARASWDETLAVLKQNRFSRYPLVNEDPDSPRGIIHVKDLVLSGGRPVDLAALVRPCLSVLEDTPLESLLADMQKKRIHLAIVRNAAGQWTGMITFEDVIEEIIGTIRDEFEDEEHLLLSDVVEEQHVLLDVHANDTTEAVRTALHRVERWQLPVSREAVIKAIDERERAVETYLGKGTGMPHARLVGLQKAVLFVIRAPDGIPYRGITERASLLFVLLTPAAQPRVHQRLQAIIATILDESEFVPDRLREAATAAEVVEVLRTGEQATLD